MRVHDHALRSLTLELVHRRDKPAGVSGYKRQGSDSRNVFHPLHGLTPGALLAHDQPATVTTIIPTHARSEVRIGGRTQLSIRPPIIDRTQAMNTRFLRTTTRWGAACLSLAALFAFTGCSALGLGRRAEAPLRVGITSDYRPMVFRQGGQVAGVEADFARQLGRDLNRPVEFVELRWEDQIPALQSGRIDIIMSGKTRTDAREVRVRFCDPYLDTGLIAMFRHADAARFTTPERVLAFNGRVGFRRGTVAETFVRENFPNARPIAYALPSDAVIELSRNRLDVYVDDGPAVAWFISENEGRLTGLFAFLARHDLAWAVARNNLDLHAAVNARLQAWKADGSYDQIIDRWLPHRRQMLEPAP